MNERIQFTVSKKVYKILEQEAQKLGMTVAAYIRLVATNHANELSNREPVKA